MLPPIYAWLTADPAVTAIVGNRIYGSGFATQSVGPRQPYITFQQVAMNPEIYFDRPADIDYDRVQVHCWSENEDEAGAIAYACRTSLQAYGYIVGGFLADYDDEAKLYRVGYDVGLWTPADGSGGSAIQYQQYQGSTFAAIAGAVITAPTVVSAENGLIVPGDITQPERVVGIAVQDALIGEMLRVQTSGILTVPGWTWAPGQIWMVDGGGFTQVAPVSGWVLEVGRALDITAMLVGIKTAVLI